MYCQACGAFNPEDEREYCARCQQKLLIVSGAAEPGEGEGGDGEEGIPLDEHLLERVSILEEALRHTAEGVRQLAETLGKHERASLVNHTALAALRDLLEQKRLIGGEEWRGLWKAKVDEQLHALDKRQRFVGVKDRIAGHYRGHRRRLFLRLLDDADAALGAFDMDRAFLALEAANRLDRDNPALAQFLGEVFFNQGQTELALRAFRRALKADPDQPEVLVYTGVIHHERGERERAEELLERAVAVAPNLFLPHFSLGAVYASQGRAIEAIGALERAVALEPAPQALYLLGSCLYEAARLGAAIERLEEVVRRDPAFEEAHHLLGLAYLDRHWNRKALAAFRRAQRLNPKRLRYHDLVRYLSGQANPPLPSVRGRAGRWFARAEDQLGRGNAERALVCFRRAIAHDPENPTLLISYAMACLHADRSRESEQVTRKLLALGPSEMLKATAYATLIEALRSEGRYREGHRIGRDLLEEGTSSFAKTIAYYEMACNLAEMDEDLDLALDYARRSLEHSPEELKQFPLAALGWVHYKRKEFGQAIEFLSRSTELGPSTTTLTNLGMALLAAGEEGRARRVLAEARQLDSRGASLEQKMMECMQDSRRLLERVQRGQRR